MRHRRNVARQLRRQSPGARYHVGAKATHGCTIVHDDADRHVLLHLMGTSVVRHSWTCLAFCVMTTHYHWIVETPALDLDRGLHWVNGTYASYFNRRHKRKGHLFGDRYFSRTIERDEHALEAPRYVELNPVRAGICTSPTDWPWSSHRALLGLAPAPSWLHVKSALGVFGAETNLEAARRRYAEFVADAVPAARLAAASDWL